MRGFKGLPVTFVRHVIREALLGLDRIHTAGLIHSDLKPENIMISPPGNDVSSADSRGNCVYGCRSEAGLAAAAAEAAAAAAASAAAAAVASSSSKGRRRGMAAGGATADGDTVMLSHATGDGSLDTDDSMSSCSGRSYGSFPASASAATSPRHTAFAGGHRAGSAMDTGDQDADADRDDDDDDDSSHDFVVAGGVSPATGGSGRVCSCGCPRARGGDGGCACSSGLRMMAHKPGAATTCQVVVPKSLAPIVKLIDLGSAVAEGGLVHTYIQSR